MVPFSEGLSESEGKAERGRIVDAMVDARGEACWWPGDPRANRIRPPRRETVRAARLLSESPS
jgi:hypothetical protein